MKKLILITLLLSTMFSFSQTSKTLEFDNITREYLEYVPPVYDGSEAVPLILCLHGLGDNMTNFYNIGMNYIADTANFIFLTPQALDDVIYGYHTGTAWNSGASSNGVVINEDIDDVGFLMAIVDSTKALYNIDDTRIYVMGFSMGGFMSNKLACQLSGEIAAIASVSGTIGDGITCNPEFPIPVCHFHGTNDGTVAYVDNAYGNDAEELVEYWRVNNNCDVNPVVTNLPDLADDGRTVDYYFYGNGDDNTTVEFYKINNGEHDWMYQPNFDISYSIEIWKFFRKQQNLSLNIGHVKRIEPLTILPNPAKEKISINYRLKNNKNTSSVLIKIYNIQGQLVYKTPYSNSPKVISIKNLEEGIYFVKVDGETRKLIIE